MKSKAVCFVVCYVTLLDVPACEKDQFRNKLKNVVSGVRRGDHLLVLMGVNARNCVRESRCDSSKVMAIFGRDELNNNGERLLLQKGWQHACARHAAFLPHVLAGCRKCFSLQTLETVEIV